MVSGKKILTALLIAGSLCCSHVFAQYNSSTTPRSNSGASKAIKKNPVINKKSSTTDTKKPSASTQPAKKTQSINKTSTHAPKTAVVKKTTVTKKTGNADVAPATSNTVSTTNKKEERNYDYNNAIGIRAGQTSGITFKHFFSSNEAIEGIVGLWPNAVGITGLYEKYVPSENVDGFSWYFGGGGHMSFSTGRLYYVYHEGRYYSYRSTYPGFGVGIDGIVGAEYKLPTVPFAISFDIKPFIEVNGSGVIFTAFDPGLGIKFTFK